MDENKFICETAGIRIDKYISDLDLGISRSSAVNLIENGSITLNGEKVSKKYKIALGDVLEINIPEPVPSFCSPWSQSSRNCLPVQTKSYRVLLF